MTYTSIDERIELVVVFARLETIRRYVPKGISTDPGGAVSISYPVVIPKLFGYPPRERLEWWLKACPFYVSFPNREPWMTSPNEAAVDARVAFLDSHPSRECIRAVKYYVIPSIGTEDRLRAYMVIVGDIRNPPSHAVAGQFPEDR